MSMKEDRYPKEYKHFPNDKPISSSQSNNNNSSSNGNGSSNSSSNGSSSSSSKQRQPQPQPQPQTQPQPQPQPQLQQQQQQPQRPDFRETLKNTISRHMKGFPAKNVITYRRFRNKSTFQRPGPFAELVAADDEDAFTADPKEAWPVMQDMNVDIPMKELTKQHRVVDCNWTVPVSKKKFKLPEPIYPQSTGVKLRKIEDIMNEYSKKAPPQTLTTVATPALSLPSSASLKPTKSLTPKTISIPRVADKGQRPLQLMPDKIKGILQNITDTSRKPAATIPSKNQSNSSKIKLPRKPSALKSSAVSPQEPRPKKQATLITKPLYPQPRPRVSSKTIPMEKATQIDNIPDLIEARKYLVGHDEVEFRNLSCLQEMAKDTVIKKKPQLYIRLYPKPDEHTTPKGLAQCIAKNVSVKKEKAASLASNKKNKTKTSTQSKNTTSLPLNPSTKSGVVQINSRKQSQSDQSQAPTRTLSSSTTKSKKNTSSKEEKSRRESITHTTAKSEQQAYSSSVSAEFLRSTKIPKRNSSTYKSSHDMELEEGETISPSPSPIPAKSRAHQTDVDDGSSNNERRTSLPNARKTSTSSATTTTTTTNAKRRDEDKSNRDRVRDRYRDESSSSSGRRERANRHRSKSRSRSPVSNSHRPESKNRRPSSPPPSSRRQTSLESNHRRRSPPARPERENTRAAEKESIVATAIITRPEKDTSRNDNEVSSTSTSRTERSDKVDKERESSGRVTKRKLLDDAEAAPESKASANEPPAKRMTISKTNNNKDEKSSAHNTSSHAATIEKDTKYTNIANPVSNPSKTAKKPASTPKPVSMTNTATPTSSFNSASTPLTAATHTPDKAISATAPNAETPEQYKIFTIMFKQLAHANKRRGDTQKESLIGIIDHFHALCNYILNFYFVDKVNTNIPFKQASVAWKSLFPFCDNLLSKLQANNLNELYGLCVRLIALIRYYIYSRMESATRPLLTKHLSGIVNQEGSYTDRKCIEMTEGLLREHEKAEKCFAESEKHLSFGKLASQFPATFRDVCIDGNILAGITLGGEAGVSVGPMFPFTPYSPLHHAAIVSKCILDEYVTKNNMNYSPIMKPEEFM